jgi:DNA-binding transcriptional ArsR family regulator
MTDDPDLAADEIFGERPEPKPPDAHGQMGVSPADGEGENWEDLAGPEPSKKSVNIGLFARFPNTFFSSGMARKLGTAGTVLYIALCEHANREPSNTFKASDKTLAWETDLSPRTIRNKRIKLQENGLVQYSREPGQSFTYTLLRQKLQWFKVAERQPREKRRPRAMAAIRAKQEL